MSALILSRETPQMDLDTIVPRLLELPVAAGQHFFPGAMVATNAAGLAVVPTEASNLIAQGICIADANNALGPDRAINVKISVGTFGVFAGGGNDAVTIANRGQIVYMIDDQTVGLTPGAASVRSPAGYVVDVQGLQVFVALGQPALNHLPVLAVGGYNGTLFNSGVPTTVTASTPGVFVPITGVVGSVTLHGESALFAVSCQVFDPIAESFRVTIGVGIDAGGPIQIMRAWFLSAGTGLDHKFLSGSIVIPNISADTHTVQLYMRLDNGTSVQMVSGTDFVNMNYIEI